MGLFRRILALGKRPRLQREHEDELRQHLQMRIEANLAKGMSLEEATRAGRLRFGNPTVMRERVEAEDAALGLDSFVRDLRYALRGIAKSPGFACVTLMTLALGIGANTAIFELLDALRLRSLPIQAPQELAELRIAGGNHGFGVGDGPYAQFTIPMWQEIRRHHDPFSGVFAWRTSGVMIGKSDENKQVNGIEVSGEFFRVLGVAPWQGRLIQPEDEAGCQISRVVVSYPFWKNQMGSQPITANSSITVEGRTVQVLGVTAPSFLGLAIGERFDLAYPTCTPPNPRREIFTYSVMGRLKPGWTIDRASAWLDSISPGLFESTAPTGYSTEAVKTFKDFRLAAYPAAAGVSTLRNAYNSSLMLLLAITGLVLLIACANLANLMLARSSARQREMAIRIALGASRARLLRQLLIENGLLAFLGAACGVALAQPLGRLLIASFNTSQSSIQLTLVPDWRVLLFAAAAAIFTAVIFGTAPALRGMRTDPMGALQAGARGVSGNRESFSINRLLVVTQIAVSMVLLVGALLFVHSYRNLVTLDPGMRENGITAALIGFPGLQVVQENLAEFKRQVVDDIRSVPGVQNAASTTNTPLSGNTWSHGVQVGGKQGSSRFTYASPSYFATMGIPLLTGRNFTEADTNHAPLVLIVNKSFVRTYFGNASPLGQAVHVFPEPRYPERVYHIVGTIPDSKYNDLRADLEPIAYVPAAQLPVTAQPPFMAIMVASSGATPVNAIQHAVKARYPAANIQFVDLQQTIHDNLVGDRVMAMLSGFFGLIAALLVAVGLYGVLSFFITQRRSEIGIRIALGAGHGQIIGLVLRDTIAMLLVGVVLGLGLALIGGKAASTVLFGLKPYDLATLAFAFVLVAVVSLLASWLPARKASRLDPVAALRSE
jgi:predicted permease